MFSVSVSTVFAAFGLQPRRTGARLARALSRRSIEMPVLRAVRGRSSDRAPPRARAGRAVQQPGAASAQRQAALAALVADAEAEFDATHGDDGSSAASVTIDEHANDSDGFNVSSFQSATSSEVAAIAAGFKAWARGPSPRPLRGYLV